MFPDVDVFDTPKPEALLERIIHIATNPGELVVDIFGGSGTTAAVAHKMRRRWVIVERNMQTVLDFLLPRMQRVVDGSDFGGVTDATSWTGGGHFEMVNIPPRFGILSGRKHAGTVKRQLATQARSVNKQSSHAGAHLVAT
jgi:adenine-specific DNA-methyltransferase